MLERDSLSLSALTKIQSIILITIITFGVFAGVTSYYILSNNGQSSESIRIGVLSDLDGIVGKGIYQMVILAAEQINEEGGLLGKKVEVIGEDTDFESGVDITKISSALTRLITYDKVDFVIGQAAGEAGFVCQDICADHKKIILLAVGVTEGLTQRVLDDYERYKYFFRIGFNDTSVFNGITDSLLGLREKTGFNKIGYLGIDFTWTKGVMEGLDSVLPEVHGFDLVYKGKFPLGTVDFSSYFASAEAAGVEVLIPLISGNDGIPFIKEYYDRQSTMFLYGGVITAAQSENSWEYLDGKCEYISVGVHPIVAGYSLTNQTLQVRKEYIDMWGENLVGSNGYDALRFILADAIERAGTIDTNEVINALEKTSIETCSARNFIFTSSHDTMVGENPNDPDADYSLIVQFQWQNGELIPVHPKKLMQEAGTTFLFPPWDGPWDDIS